MNEEISKSFNEITDKLFGWVSAIIENLPNIGIALVVLIASYYSAKIISKWAKRLAGRHIEQITITKLIGRSVAIVIVLTGLFLALGVLDLGKTLNTLLAGAGISGLVIGLALQGTLTNTFSGIVLSFRKKIQIGDWVETTGYTGEVMDINLNNFVIKEADNNLVIIPNKTIIENPMKNYTLTTKMRIMIECGVGYGMNLNDVEKITKEAIAKSFDHIEKADDIEFYFTEFGDSSINFLCRFWVVSENGLEKLRAKSKAIIEIKKAFDQEEINIPFPIRTLQFEDNLHIRKERKLETIN